MLKVMRTEHLIPIWHLKNLPVTLSHLPKALFQKNPYSDASIPAKWTPQFQLERKKGH